MVRSYTHLRDVSNPILYDSLLVHHLARELDETLVRRRIRGLEMDASARRIVLELDGVVLVWELHPARGRLQRLDRPPVRDPEATAAAGRIRLPRQGRIAAVEAVRDERVLSFVLSGAGRSRIHRLTVELLTNQWNALALDGGGRIAAVLWSREAGGRRLVPGAVYTAPQPPGGPRAGHDEVLTAGTWNRLLGHEAPRDRRRALVRSVAWTSPLNAGAILGRAGDPDASRADADRALPDALERYRTLAPPSAPDPAPRVLDLPRGPTAYPVPLPGVADEPVDTILDAMAAVTHPEAEAAVTPEALDRLEEHRASLERRLEALRAELRAAPDAALTLRSRADLLLARLNQVERGRERVELEDFSGETVEVSLDPGKSPAHNAELMYEQAAKRERAAEKLPAVVAATEARLQRLEALLEGVEGGTPDHDGLRQLLADLEADRDKGPRSQGKRLPYRTYRTSGGLEVRVGRGRKANDALTFHHSSPDDIWLHARDAAGAHVVLRWPNREQNPPKRDLHEAAALAAWHSKARTSGTVPVDWTRRKYVRKPRNAPPGLVAPDRVETVFVEPDEALERRLRA